MANRERSRSHGGQSEWISRAIVGFGRYPEKRPQGLTIDNNGAILLSSLMSSWGKAQGLADKDVLSAVRKHMYHNRSGGQLRFQLGSTASGDVTILVHQKRGGGPPTTATPVPTPARALAAPRGSAGAEYAAQITRGAAMQSNGFGRKWGGDNSSNWWQGTPPWNITSGNDSNPNKGWKDWQKGDYQDDWKAGGGSWGSAGCVRVQRWLAFVLARGHQEMGLTVTRDGWASLQEIMPAIIARKAEFGIEDEKQFRDLLWETDKEGRFEISSDGRIRKVPREHRFSSRPPQGSVAASLGGAPAAAPAAQAGGKASAPGAPGPPPGEHWTKYHDDGILWWYYEGPLGKWWCQNDTLTPEPFRDDE